MILTNDQLIKNKAMIATMINNLQRGINTKNLINYLLSDPEITKYAHIKDMLSSYLVVVLSQISGIDKQAEKLFYLELDFLEEKKEDAEEWV